MSVCGGERARHNGEAVPAPAEAGPERRRWMSARRKQSAVLCGEDLELVSGEPTMTTELIEAKMESMEGGRAAVSAMSQVWAARWTN